MARMPYLEIADMPEKLAETVRALPPLNIFRMLGHATTATPGFLAMGGALLSQGELDSRLRELVIVRVGILSNAKYEVHQHDRISRDVGVPEPKIQALRVGPEAPEFDEWERLVLRFTDVVVRDVKAPDDLFNEVAAKLTHRGMAELVLTIGFYMMVSRFLENFEVDIEEVPPKVTVKHS